MESYSGLLVESPKGIQKKKKRKGKEGPIYTAWLFMTLRFTFLGDKHDKRRTDTLRYKPGKKGGKGGEWDKATFFNGKMKR